MTKEYKRAVIIYFVVVNLATVFFWALEKSALPSNLASVVVLIVSIVVGNGAVIGGILLRRSF